MKTKIKELVHLSNKSKEIIENWNFALSKNISQWWKESNLYDNRIVLDLDILYRIFYF